MNASNQKKVLDAYARIDPIAKKVKDLIFEDLEPLAKIFWSNGSFIEGYRGDHPLNQSADCLIGIMKQLESAFCGFNHRLSEYARQIKQIKRNENEIHRTAENAEGPAKG